MSFDGYVNLSGMLFITGGLNVIGGILVILLMGVIGTGWNTVVPEFLTVISVLGLTLITGLFMIKGFKDTPEASANCSARGIRAGSVVMLSRTWHAPVRIANLPWRCPPPFQLCPPLGPHGFGAPPCGRVAPSLLPHRGSEESWALHLRRSVQLHGEH